MLLIRKILNIDCFNLGLSDQDQSAILSINKSNRGGAHIVSEGSKEKSDENESIELKRLDAFLPSLADWEWFLN